MNSQKHLTVEITDIALPNNFGVARHDGFVIFIPDAVVGDKVKIEILKQNKRLAYGQILEIIEPSSFRTSPACPHFGLCGGCTIQNLAYKKQLEIKESYLIETLKRIGKINAKDIKMASIVASPDLHHYRNKLELSFGESHGKIVLGMRARALPFNDFSAKVISIDQCLLSSPALKEVIPLFIEFANKQCLSAYNPTTGQGFLRHLILKESKSKDEFMVVLETTGGSVPDLAPLRQSLSDSFPKIKSFYRIINNMPGDDFHADKTYHIYGKLHIEETLNGFTFRVYPESFFQPNTKSAAILYSKIVELAQLKNNETVLGLYCGAGPIEIILAGHTKRVIGIDSERSNIINARENCKLNSVKNCQFYKGKVETVLNRINLDRIDLLIVDPPRAGISKKGLEHIYKINPKKITYVSCNPSTLARDLQDFAKRGYNINSIMPFDFFPHTSHLETLVVLDRS